MVLKNSIVNIFQFVFRQIIVSIPVLTITITASSQEPHSVLGNSAYNKATIESLSKKDILKINEKAKKHRFRNPDSMKFYANLLQSFGAANKDFNATVFGLLREGNYYSDIGDNKKAFAKYFEADELTTKINAPKLRIDLNTQLAMEYFFTRKFDKTLESAYKGIELSKKNGYIWSEARLRHILGFIYTQNKLFEEADSELSKAIELWKKTGDSLSLYGSRSNMARNSILWGKIEKAEKYFEGNISYFSKANEILWLARSYMVQCHIQLEKHQLKKALSSNKKYDSLLRKLKNPRDRILTYNLYYRLFYLSKDYEGAKLYADSTVYYSKQINDSVELLNGYESLSKMARLNSNFGEAVKYSSLGIPIKNVLDKRFREDNLKLLRTKHELEYNQLEKELEDGKRLNKQQRITLVVLILSLVFIGLLFFVRNILKKREKTNKELQELNETKNKLFSIIGHDLKSPIGTLKELLELFSSEDLSAEDISGALPRLKQNVDQSAFTLNNLLAWATNQLDGTVMMAKKVVIRKHVMQVIDLYSEMLESKNINVIYDAKPDIMVLADRDHLDLILRNLISNAIKFTPKNGQIQFNADVVDSQILFKIHDSGKGMSKLQIDTILSRNIISPSLGTNNEKGTGFGLQITKELLAMNNGRLNFDSDKNSGTTAIITLQQA